MPSSVTRTLDLSARFRFLLNVITKCHLACQLRQVPRFWRWTFLIPIFLCSCAFVMILFNNKKCLANLRFFSVALMRVKPLRRHPCAASTSKWSLKIFFLSWGFQQCKPWDCGRCAFVIFDFRVINSFPSIVLIAQFFCGVWPGLVHAFCLCLKRVTVSPSDTNTRRTACSSLKCVAEKLSLGCQPQLWFLTLNPCSKSETGQVLLMVLFRNKLQLLPVWGCLKWVWTASWGGTVTSIAWLDVSCIFRRRRRWRFVGWSDRGHRHWRHRSLGDHRRRGLLHGQQPEKRCTLGIRTRKKGSFDSLVSVVDLRVAGYTSLQVLKVRFILDAPRSASCSHPIWATWTVGGRSANGFVRRQSAWCIYCEHAFVTGCDSHCLALPGATVVRKTDFF